MLAFHSARTDERKQRWQKGAVTLPAPYCPQKLDLVRHSSLDLWTTQWVSLGQGQAWPFFWSLSSLPWVQTIHLRNVTVSGAQYEVSGIIVTAFLARLVLQLAQLMCQVHSTSLKIWRPCSSRFHWWSFHLQVWALWTLGWSWINLYYFMSALQSSHGTLQFAKASDMQTVHFDKSPMLCWQQHSFSARKWQDYKHLSLSGPLIKMQN